MPSSALCFSAIFLNNFQTSIQVTNLVQGVHIYPAASFLPLMLTT